MNTTQPQKALPEATFSDRMLEIGIKYKTQLTVLFVVICLAAGGALFWMQKSRVDEGEASLALAKLTPWLETGDVNKAINGEGSIKGLNAIAKMWGVTPSGKLARLYMANILLDSGKPDDALAMYKGVQSDNKDIQASAFAGAAACNVEKKAFVEAAPAYEKASETAENEALKSMYLDQAAASYALAGQPDKATKLYDQVIKTWPGSSQAGTARRALMRLSGAGVAVPQI
ncbi:tetratricopeptide repeat protein [Chlorobaculum sp. 24CR]|uniref:tetratricopeptide repeat protein n=1 Tax=Chlorobaculum sp. 24CR TaxID=2508878 RepID=UPI00100AA0A7|nr:tetratricopeptide repeat protein [Chlorobaculum sp. 24CR]RXK88318.1 tetratricopeptide repeat protein [Chlorobaculum sp. 24CR]